MQLLGLPWQGERVEFGGEVCPVEPKKEYPQGEALKPRLVWTEVKDTLVCIGGFTSVLDLC